MLSDVEYKQALNSTSNPAFIAAPVYDGANKIVDFTIEYANPTLCRITDYTADNGVRFSNLHDTIPESLDWFNYALESIEKERGFDITFYADWAVTWFHMTVDRTKNDKCVFIFTNVNSLKKAEQKFTRLMYTDTLTGIANRTYFNQIFNNVIEQANNDHTSVGIMVIDVDNMKSINDVSGHITGDSVLRRSAHILEKFEDENTQIFRLGDDEFLMLIINLPSKDRMSVISGAVFETFQHNNISISAGIAICPDDNNQSSNLLKYADLAMKTAKKNGKNSVVFFTPNMYQSFVHRTLLQEKLLVAFQNNSFKLYYQPQFYIDSNRLRGFEALIRWHDEVTDTWIPPDDFITVAEEIHLIAALGRWILETGCATLKQWQTDYGFKGIMSINVSPTQLKDITFLAQLEELIKKYDIQPNTLEIEITEGLLIDNIKSTVTLLQQIRKLGILLALDDFGTGYSSFKYLQYLPVNTLKIDKSFISTLDNKVSIESNITAAIISLVSKMGIDTIAEGVEHPEQLELLRKMKCKTMQGFLRGMPMEKARCNKVLSGDISALLRIGTEPPENIIIE